MWRLISKRELALQAATILDLKAEIERMRVSVEHERKRAEVAINLLLVKTVRAAITPESPTEEQQEKMEEKMLNIFGDGETTESDALEKLQS